MSNSLHLIPQKQKANSYEGNWQRVVQLTLDYKILRFGQFLLTLVNILCIIRKQQRSHYHPLPRLVGLKCCRTWDLRILARMFSVMLLRITQFFNYQCNDILRTFTNMLQINSR
jgi:hypothetical protein